MKCPHCKEEIKEVREEVNISYHHYYKMGKNGKIDEKTLEEEAKDGWGGEMYCGHCEAELDNKFAEKLWDY